MDIVIALVALALGVGLGWFFGSRPLADMTARFAARDLDARELDEKFRRAIAELAGASERASRADGLAAELAETAARNAALQGQLATATTRADSAERLAAELPELRASREALRAELATLKANAANFDEKQRLLLEAQEALKKEFQVAGAKVLEGAQAAFLQRAQERFAVAEERSEEKIKALLAPVGERLKSYEDQVSTLEKQRSDAFSQLTAVIEGLRVGQAEVRAEAAKLANALRAAPKTRGRWGEQQFKNLIEISGLSTFVDFEEEVSVTSEDGLLRPDFVIRLPGDQQLVVDVKCSLDAYLKAAECLDGEERRGFIEAHGRAVATHVEALARKAYWDQFPKAPDFVIMYIPGDNFIAAALECDMDLWERAARKRVIICGPSTFLPMARTVAGIWRQEKLAEEAQRIGVLGKEMYDRLAIAAEKLKSVGGGLNTAVKNYNDFVSSFESRVLVTGRKFRDLNVEVGAKEIKDVEPVELLPRYAETIRDKPALPLMEAGSDEAAEA